MEVDVTPHELVHLFITVVDFCRKIATALLHNTQSTTPKIDCFWLSPHPAASETYNAPCYVLHAHPGPAVRPLRHCYLHIPQLLVACFKQPTACHYFSTSRGNCHAPSPLLSTHPAVSDSASSSPFSPTGRFGMRRTCFAFLRISARCCSMCIVLCAARTRRWPEHVWIRTRSSLRPTPSTPGCRCR